MSHFLWAIFYVSHLFFEPSFIWAILFESHLLFEPSLIWTFFNISHPFYMSHLSEGGSCLPGKFVGGLKCVCSPWLRGYQPRGGWRMLLPVPRSPGTSSNRKLNRYILIHIFLIYPAHFICCLLRVIYNSFYFDNASRPSPKRQSHWIFKSFLSKNSNWATY